MEGWIKLHRKMLEWEWADSPNTAWVFIICLLKANHVKKSWHGIEIKPGQFITSLQKLATETGLSVQQVRTALGNLETTNEIDLTKSQQGKYTMVSIVSWAKHQAEQQGDNKVPTRWQQGDNKVPTSTKECKNEKNDNNEEKVKGDPLNFSETLADVQTPKAKAIKIWTDYYSPVIGQDSADYVDMILRKIAAHQKEANKANGTPNAKVTDEQKLLLFEQLCERMPDFYKTKASPKLVYSNFDSIFAEIVNQSQKDKPTDFSKIDY